jgi:two-component system response regulator NreC
MDSDRIMESPNSVNRYLMRLMIIDDHGVLRAGLRSMLQGISDFNVVRDCTGGEEILNQIQLYKPDVVLLDISMPGLNGLELTKRISKTFPGVKILILTYHENSTIIQTAFRYGANGYILKAANQEELVGAIRTVACGNIYIYPSLKPQLTIELDDGIDKLYSSESLTPREVEVLKLLAQGLTSQQIAEKLFISVRTVESHRASLQGKLNVHTRSEILNYAVHFGYRELA